MSYFLSKLPKTVKNIAVMDRSREFISNAELMYKEVLTCLFKTGQTNIKVKNCTYGICGAEILPSDIEAVYESFHNNLPDTLRVGIKGQGEEYLVPIVNE